MRGPVTPALPGPQPGLPQTAAAGTGRRGPGTAGLRLLGEDTRLPLWPWLRVLCSAGWPASHCPLGPGPLPRPSVMPRGGSLRGVAAPWGQSSSRTASVSLNQPTCRRAEPDSGQGAQEGQERGHGGHQLQELRSGQGRDAGRPSSSRGDRRAKLSPNAVSAVAWLSRTLLLRTANGRESRASRGPGDHRGSAERRACPWLPGITT